MQKVPLSFTWDQIKNRISSRLLSTVWHAEKIKSLVTIPLAADVVQAFYICVDGLVENPPWSTEGQSAYIGITPSLLSYLGKTVTDLLNATAASLHGSARPMSDFFPVPIDETGQQMYVVSTEEKAYGASAVLDPSVQETLSSVYPSGFYILMSSVHECLAVASSSATPEDLKAMVYAINRSEVQPEDRLSDSVFILRNGCLAAAV